MGAPKQKWTAEEEEALKEGVRKHSAGKWQTILRDPQFRDVLHSRSNVDLKDKWRNINVTASGLGSREKARVALKKNPQTPKRTAKHGSLNGLAEDVEIAAKPKLHSVSSFSDKLHATESKRNLTRLESVILEALTALKEPKGSEKNAVATYIEERYWEPPNLRKLLSSKLRSMTSAGKLVKAKHRYRIAPNLTQPEVGKMRSMWAHEAAAAAALAVAEAEAAIAEAERAARNAEAAEAEAEAARIFAQAAISACHKLSIVY